MSLHMFTRVSGHTYAYLYLYLHVQAHVHTHVHTCLSTSLSTCLQRSLHARPDTNAYAQLSSHMPTNMSTHTSMHISIYMFTHTRPDTRAYAQVVIHVCQTYMHMFDTCLHRCLRPYLCPCLHYTSFDNPIPLSSNMSTHTFKSRVHQQELVVLVLLFHRAVPLITCIELISRLQIRNERFGSCSLCLELS